MTVTLIETSFGPSQLPRWTKPALCIGWWYVNVIIFIENYEMQLLVHVIYVYLWLFVNQYQWMNLIRTWWRHQMETFSALLVICAGNSPVPGEFPTQRPVTRIFDVYFDLRLNTRLCKQSWGWWIETLLCPLWRHSNESHSYVYG